MPGKVRRALDGQILSDQRNGESIEIVDGRLEARISRTGGLVLTGEGLGVDLEQVGEKNHTPLDRLDAPTTVTAAALQAWAEELTKQLKKTGRMR